MLTREEINGDFNLLESIVAAWSATVENANYRKERLAVLRSLALIALAVQPRPLDTINDTAALISGDTYSMARLDLDGKWRYTDGGEVVPHDRPAIPLTAIPTSEKKA